MVMSDVQLTLNTSSDLGLCFVNPRLFAHSCVAFSEILDRGMNAARVLLTDYGR